MKIAGIGTLVLFVAAAADAGEKVPKCHEDAFEGRCVVAQVNGQKTVKMTKNTKKLLKEHMDRSSRPFAGCAAYYEVPQPVRGTLDLRFSWLPEAVAYFGSGAEAQVNVVPLEGQRLETRTELSAASSVRAGGSAVMTQTEVVESNQLPPGKYVFVARVSGSTRSWDCHGFFVQVAE